MVCAEAAPHPRQAPFSKRRVRAHAAAHASPPAPWACVDGAAAEGIAWPPAVLAAAFGSEGVEGAGLATLLTGSSMCVSSPGSRLPQRKGSLSSGMPGCVGQGRTRITGQGL
eukprot:1158533-Pelagomonas_calceolata.AAC.13